MATVSATKPPVSSSVVSSATTTSASTAASSINSSVSSTAVSSKEYTLYTVPEYPHTWAVLGWPTSNNCLFSVVQKILHVGLAAFVAVAETLANVAKAAANVVLWTVNVIIGCCSDSSEAVSVASSSASSSETTSGSNSAASTVSNTSDLSNTTVSIDLTTPTTNSTVSKVQKCKDTVMNNKAPLATTAIAGAAAFWFGLTALPVVATAAVAAITVKAGQKVYADYFLQKTDNQEISSQSTVTNTTKV